ncbi:hypothetical protein [Desulfopila sp. IMCC35008]|uniref:hypothetical protein n=1 Tax=Desulfopila sp. IMCC35008 TaxID=2653858 RepID=UPI0013D69309|nr:hypothetical protein [Desulfopila sp. IMCC35008]
MNVDNSYYCYKGARNYVHSTEIFNSIIFGLAYGDQKNIDFSLSTQLKNEWELTSIKPVGEVQVVGYFKLAKTTFYILETTNPVSRRVVDKEQSILDASMIEAASISIPFGSIGCTAIEGIVSGFKLLLQNEVYKETMKKYLFMRVTLKYIPDESVTVLFKRRFGKKFLEGEIFCKEVQIGKIYFIDE